jgi:hypothetical protein
MTTAGWLLMSTSITFVMALTGYCFWRVMRTPVTKDHMHAPLDIETNEEEE